MAAAAAAILAACVFAWYRAGQWWMDRDGAAWARPLVSLVAGAGVLLGVFLAGQVAVWLGWQG